MTFGVVTISLLVQGMTMAPLLNWLGITRRNANGKDEYELRRGAIVVARAALEALPSAEGLPADMVAALRSEHERNLSEAKAALDDLHYARSQLRQENLQAARRHILQAQRKSLYDAKQRGIVSQHAFEEILRKLDTELLAIEETPEAPIDSKEPRVESDPTDQVQRESESGQG
jgi:CPA1 family monovalent cation:H+ antiporter